MSIERGGRLGSLQGSCQAVYFRFYRRSGLLQNKTKEGSLQHVMRDQSAPNGYMIHMTKNFQPVFIPAHGRASDPREFE